MAAGRPAVERAPAVVGDLDRRSAGGYRRTRVLGPSDALDDHRQAGDVADHLDVVPAQVGLERRLLAVREIAVGQPRARIAQAHVFVGRALADRVYCQHDGLEAGSLGALQHRARKAVVGGQVDLEPLGAVARLGDVFHAGRGRARHGQ